MLKRHASVKTSLLFILISTLPLFFAVFAILHFAVKARNEAIQKQLLSEVEQTLFLLDSYIKNNVLKSAQTLSDFIFAIDAAAIDPAMKKSLIVQLLGKQEISGVLVTKDKKYYLNPNSSKVALSEVIPYGFYLADSLAQLPALNNYIKPAIKFFNHDSIPYLFWIAYPKNSTSFRNSLIVFTKLSPLPDLFKNLNHYISAFFLVNEKGQLAYQTEYTTEFLIKAQDIKNWFISWRKSKERGSADETISAKRTKDGKPFLVLTRHLPEVKKTLFFFKPAVTYATLLRNFYPPLFIGLFFVLAVVLTLNYLAYIRIFRPIHRLTKAAYKAAQNNFDIHVEITRNDEIGRLTQVFNKAMAQIRLYNQINIDKIINERKKLEHIIEQLAGGILIVGTENDILICNHVLAEWYNLDKQELISKKLSELNEFQVYDDMVREITQEKNSSFLHKKITYRPPNVEKPMILQASAANIFTSGNTFLGTSIYIRDITKEYEIDKLKSELISIVAHELRSPLVSIIGFSEILLESGAKQELCNEYLKIINMESNRLSDFVENFLDLTKIESGSFTLNLKEANFIKTVKQVIMLYSAQAINKHIEIRTDFKPPIIVLNSDSMLIERAIGNFLSNAIKYNPPETQIIVKTYLKNNYIHLEVADNGVGIAEENLDKVFQKFFRISGVVENNSKGSGLGLSFVKRVIEKHGGKVYVHSKINEGSVFGFRLPLRERNESEK